MTLTALIRKRFTGSVATAIPAIVATQPHEQAATVARIATIAVANPRELQAAPTTAANDQQALPSNAPDPQADIPEDLREAFEERAAIMEFDGGLSREEAERQAWHLVSRERQALPSNAPDPTTNTPSNPDRWAWPHSSAMNSTEIDTMQARLVRFTDRGLSYDEAERLADSLMRRDRDGWQAWVSCFECRHLQGTGRWRCANWRQADVPQVGLARDLVLNTARCAGFSEVAT